MLGSKTLRHLLNGGGAAAGTRGLRAAIAEIEEESANLRAEANSTAKLIADAAMTDDPAKRIAAVRCREQEIHDELSVNEIRQAKLRDKLTELIDIERRARIKQHIEIAIALRDEVDAAVTAALSVNERCDAAWAAAVSDLGGADAERLVAQPRYLGMLNPLGFADWRRFHLSSSANMRSTLAALAAPQAPPLRAVASTAASNVTAAATSGAKPPAAKRQGAAPSPKPLRAPFRDQAGAGLRLISVLRDGYEAPDGRQCRQGDVIAVSPERADIIVKNGAADYASEP
jgi:hypothetical protein